MELTRTNGFTFFLRKSEVAAKMFACLLQHTQGVMWGSDTKTAGNNRLYSSP